MAELGFNSPPLVLNLTRKSKPDYNNQELGTTKARRTRGSQAHERRLNLNKNSWEIPESLRIGEHLSRMNIDVHH
jgi:hypothetical protein